MVVVVYSERQSITIVNILDCVPRVYHVRRTWQYNTYEQAKHHDEGRSTCTRNKSSALVQY